MHHQLAMKWRTTVDINEFYRQVDAIYNNEDWDAAEELFNAMMNETSNDPELHATIENELGVCCMKRGMQLEAVEHLLSAETYFASTHGAKSGEALSIKTNLARAYSAMGDHEKARDLLGELCELQSNTDDDAPILYDACVGIGHESRLIGDYDSAIEYLNRAMSIARQYEQAEPLIACLFDLGVIQFERGHRGEAVNALSEAMEVCRQANLSESELGQTVAAFYSEMSKSACCGCSGELAQSPITVEDE
jgi:FimV-like protein